MPKKYKARDIKTGEWVEGWYVVLNAPLINEHSELIGYEPRPSIFNDEPGNRQGSYWHEIDPKTLCEL